MNGALTSHKSLLNLALINLFECYWRALDAGLDMSFLKRKFVIAIFLYITMISLTSLSAPPDGCVTVEHGTYSNYYKDWGDISATVFARFNVRGDFVGWRMVFDNKYFYNYDYSGDSGAEYIMHVAEGAHQFFVSKRGYLPCRWNRQNAVMVTWRTFPACLNQ